MPDDVMPDQPIMGLENTGEELPENSCPECAEAGIVRAFRRPVNLGAHRKSAHNVKGQGPAGSRKKPKADGPPKVDVSFTVKGNGTGKGKDAANIARTTKGATSFAKTLAVGLGMMGQGTDAAIIAESAETWGKAIGDLSEYQPVLHKIFAPTGEVTGQAAAWMAVLMVTGGMALPIAANHGVIKVETLAKMGLATGALFDLQEAGNADVDAA
jgi:hypothetical protein